MIRGLTRYQWLVLLAAWLGWGFDVFDGLLFNYVSPLAVPDLLHLPAGEKAQTTLWTGVLTCALLVGWGAGGILFGKLTDRLGRTRTLLLTMLTYALATAACALAPNLLVLGAFRFVASLGIGGEWAAGASLVAETVPEDKRVQAGALLYTSGPAGLFLATFVNDLFARQLALPASLSWRLVFLTGLVPAAAAIAIRWKVREPEKWHHGAQPRVAELFSPELRRRTLGGLALAVIALVTWWTCNAFLPSIAHFLADEAGVPAQRTAFATTATSAFQLGGLLGTLGCVPIAMRLGRRQMFYVYFILSAIFIWLGFGSAFPPRARLYLMGLQGLTVFGIFGGFTFYLPELFPTRLRGTGAGFTYNTGRFLTAPFPLLVGLVAQHNPSGIIQWVALVPLFGVVLLLFGFGEETRHHALD